MPALAILSQLFMVWMLIDAAQRRMDFYWYIIILVPFGEWVYFFAVKINDYDLTAVKRWFGFDRPPPLADIRHLAEETPSLDNQLKLADALRAHQQHDEAIVLYRSILERDDTETDALYGLGISELGRDQPTRAVDAFARLIDLDSSYRDWDAWPNLAFAYQCAEKGAESVAVLQKLAEKAPRIRHKVWLGKALGLDGQRDAAREVLEAAIKDYRYAQGFVKRHNGRWARQARVALRELPAS